MNRLRIGATAVAVVAWLSACGSQDEPKSPDFGTVKGALHNSDFEIDKTAGGALVADLKPNNNVAPGPDWHSPPLDLRAGLDDPNKQTDNAFGQGAKDDIPNPTVVTNSIPPSKDNLVRFYFAHEVVADSNHDADALPDVYAYMAWERDDTNGSANMSIELNKGTAGIDGNGVTPTRTGGDVLIHFDWASGANIINLSVTRWLPNAAYALGKGLTGDAKKDCEANAKFPCWGNKQALGTAVADASVNNTNDVCDRLVCPGDPTPPTSCAPIVGPGNDLPNAAGSCGAARKLTTKTFGEIAINLSAAGLLDEGCLASAYLKSRASDAFDAELKDFISPIGTDLCAPAKIQIRKQDEAGEALAGAVFQLWYDADESGDLDADCSGGTDDGTCDDVQVAKDGGGLDCTTTLDDAVLCDGSTDQGVGDCKFTVNTAGKYIAHEKTPPPGYQLDPGGDQDVDVVIGAAASCTIFTFTDPLAPGIIRVVKKDDQGNLLDGAVFKLWNDVDESGTLNAGDTVADPDNTCTTGELTGDTDKGLCSFGLHDPGFYCVEETSAPTGHFDASPKVKCGELAQQTSSLPLVFEFTNERQFKVIVVVCEEAGGTLYGSTVDLDVDQDGTAGNDAGEQKTSARSAVEDALASALCATTQGANYTPLKRGDHKCLVNIPDTPVPADP